MFAGPGVRWVHGDASIGVDAGVQKQIERIGGMRAICADAGEHLVESLKRRDVCVRRRSLPHARRQQ
jgi:hypothetical protein